MLTWNYFWNLKTISDDSDLCYNCTMVYALVTLSNLRNIEINQINYLFWTTAFRRNNNTTVSHFGWQFILPGNNQNLHNWKEERLNEFLSIGFMQKWSKSNACRWLLNYCWISMSHSHFASCRWLYFFVQQTLNGVVVSNCHCNKTNLGKSQKHFSWGLVEWMQSQNKYIVRPMQLEMRKATRIKRVRENGIMAFARGTESVFECYILLVS